VKTPYQVAPLSPLNRQNTAKRTDLAARLLRCKHHKSGSDATGQSSQLCLIPGWATVQRLHGTL
jgi:hypothetical protein